MSEWCECLNFDENYTHLLAVANPVIFVHECGKPSFGVWQSFEDYCDECGRSFSSPADSTCNRHGGMTWQEAWEESREIHTRYLTTT